MSPGSKKDIVKRSWLPQISGINTLSSRSFDSRTSIMINAGIIVSIIILLGYSLFYILTDLHEYLLPIISLLSLIPVLLLSAYLNNCGKFIPAVIIFSIAIYLSVAFPCIVFVGKNAGIHYHLLYFSLIPIITFPLNRIFYIAFFILLNQVTFYYVEIFLPKPLFPLELAENLHSAFRNGSIITSLIALSGIIVMNQYILNLKEKRMQVQNSELTDLNEELREKSIQIEKQSAEISRTNVKLEFLTQELSLKLTELDNINTSKDNIFRVVGHDLKGPVGNIEAFADLLIIKANDRTDEKTLKYASLIKNQSVQILHTLEKIFLWAESHRKGITYNPKEQDLIPVIKESVSLLELSANSKGLNIDIKIQPELSAYFDKELIGVVIRNLLNNAIKYSRENSIVSIKSEVLDNYIKILFSDNGIGISKERQEHLFSGEYLLSVPGTRSEVGTGIGLRICKNYIDQHGGLIGVESQLNEGSTFYFTLPLSNHDNY